MEASSNNGPGGSSEAGPFQRAQAPPVSPLDLLRAVATSVGKQREETTGQGGMEKSPAGSTAPSPAPPSGWVGDASRVASTSTASTQHPQQPPPMMMGGPSPGMALHAMTTLGYGGMMMGGSHQPMMPQMMQGHQSSTAPAPAPQPQAPTCVSCSRSKVKCDRAQPVCGRCRRLKLECLPQLRRRGRPMKLNQSLLRRDPYPPAPPTAAASSSSSSSSEPGTQAMLMLQPPRPASTSEAAAVAPPSSSSGGGGGGGMRGGVSPLSPVLLSALQLTDRSDTSYPDHIRQWFLDAYTAGKVKSNKAAAVLTSWQLWNIQQGSDCTDGALSSLTAILGATVPEPTDLQAMYPPDEESEEMLQEFLDSSPLSHGAACCTVVWRRGVTEITSNERFHAMYMPREELESRLRSGAQRPWHIWTRLLSLESRRPFVRDHCAILFQVATTGGEAWRPLLVTDRFGLELLSIVLQRHFISPCGWYFASQLYLLPVSHKGTDLLLTPAPVARDTSREASSCFPGSADDWARFWLAADAASLSASVMSSNSSTSSGGAPRKTSFSSNNNNSGASSPGRGAANNGHMPSSS